MASVPKKKRRIKYKNVFIFTFIIFSIVGLIVFLANRHVKNIYIVGNTFFTDQEIIDLANLRDYPKVYKVNTNKIEKKLKDNIHIKNVSVKRSHLFQEITIKVEENIPILYYEYNEAYLLADGSTDTGNYDLPILINQTPENILSVLLTKLEALDRDVLYRISEIKYAPTNVDDKLFYLTMNDGNDVYINFDSFSKLNDYIDIIRRVDKKKGTLHLDSGDYLEVYEE